MPLERLESARRGASASHTAPTPLLWELTHVCGASHFELIFGGPERIPNGTENGSQNGRPKGPKTDPQRELKDGSQRRISRGSFPKSCATSHRFASHGVRSHRVASHRTASSRVSPGRPSKREKTILENVR